MVTMLKAYDKPKLLWNETANLFKVIYVAVTTPTVNVYFFRFKLL